MVGEERQHRRDRFGPHGRGRGVIEVHGHITMVRACPHDLVWAGVLLRADRERLQRVVEHGEVSGGRRLHHDAQ
jgi:hypothetical protein